MVTRYEDLVALGEESCRKFAERPLFGEKHEDAWRWTTYAQFQELVDAARAGLALRGVGTGDRVAIVSRNRLEWAVAAYATYGLGATLVPMYEAQRHEEQRYILEDSGARLVIAGGASTDALRQARASLPTVEHVIALDAPLTDPDGWATLLADGRARRVASVRPDPGSVAGFVYTSGTTGLPKGVMLSHRNLTSNIAAATEVFPVAPDDRSVSFLPWAHAYGQVVEVHIIVSCGASTALNRELDHLVDDLAEIHPTILVAVPRIFDRIHDAVRTQIASRPSVIRALFHAGLRNARRRAAGEHLGPIEGLELRLADRLIFAKVRARFGGRLRYAISASASLSQEVAEFVDALGIPVYEGYGLTETSPVATTNRPGARRIGTVGQPIPGVTIDIDVSGSMFDGVGEGEGEIIVRGPNVMVGYHHRPEETARTLDAAGGLRTGDLGFLDPDGYLHITGRIKEQYKLANGKYVMPTPLEQELALSPFIANVMLYGDGKPFNVALVVVDVAAVRAWAAREGIRVDDPTTSAEVRAMIGAELDRASKGFRPFERPRAFAMITQDFSIDDDLLTPTLKLKRRNVVKRWGALLESLYQPPPVDAAAAITARR